MKQVNIDQLPIGLFYEFSQSGEIVFQLLIAGVHSLSTSSDIALLQWAISETAVFIERV